MYLGESYCDVRKYGGILHVFKKSEKLWVHRIGNAWRMPFDDECKVLSLDKSLEIGSKGYFQINDLYIYVLKRKTNGALGICSIHSSMSKSLNVTWKRVLMLKITGYYVCQEDDVVVSCIMRGAWSGLREWKKSMEGMCTRFAEWGYALKLTVSSIEARRIWRLEWIELHVVVMRWIFSTGFDLDVATVTYNSTMLKLKK